MITTILSLCVWFYMSTFVECQTLQFDTTKPVGFIHFHQVYNSDSTPPFTITKAEVDKHIHDTTAATKAKWTSLFYENIISADELTFHIYSFVYESNYENIFDDLQLLDNWDASYFTTISPFNNSDIGYISSGYTQCSDCISYYLTTHNVYTLKKSFTNYASFPATVLYHYYDTFDDLLLSMTNIMFISAVSNGGTFTFSWYELYKEIFGNETIINGECKDDFIVYYEGVTSICNYYIIIDTKSITHFANILQETNNLESDELEELFLSSSYLKTLNDNNGIYVRFIPYTTILCRDSGFCAKAFKISQNPTTAPTYTQPTVSPTPHPSNDALQLPYCVKFGSESSWSDEWDYDYLTTINQQDTYIKMDPDCDSGLCYPQGEIHKYFNSIGYTNIALKFKIVVPNWQGYNVLTGQMVYVTVRVRYKCDYNSWWDTLATYSGEGVYENIVFLPSQCDNYKNFGIKFEYSYSYFYLYDVCICATNDESDGYKCSTDYVDAYAKTVQPIYIILAIVTMVILQ